MNDPERYQRDYDRVMQQAEDLARQGVNSSVETVWRKMEKSMNEVYDRFGLTQTERVSAEKKFRDWSAEYIRTS